MYKMFLKDNDTLQDIGPAQLFKSFQTVVIIRNH